MIDLLLFLLTVVIVVGAIAFFWSSASPATRKKLLDSWQVSQEGRERVRAQNVERLAILEPIFTCAYARHVAGDFSPESLHRTAREEGADYIRRAAEIKRAYDDPGSPIRNQAECAEVAAFLKGHARHNATIGFRYDPSSSWDSFSKWSWSSGFHARTNRDPTPEEISEEKRSREAEHYRAAYRAHFGVEPPLEAVVDPHRRPGLSEQQIAAILFNHHCHDWNVLQLATGRIMPEGVQRDAETPADEFARERVSLRQGTDRARREILAAQKARIASIEADSELGQEEKTRLIEAVTEDTKRDLDTLDRKSRRV